MTAGNAAPLRPEGTPACEGGAAAVSSASAIDVRRPGSEKDITEVSGTSSPGSTPGRGTQ